MNHHAPPARLMKQPSWLLAQASANAHRLVTQGLARAGGRGYHYRLLAVLDEFGPASQAALGRHTQIDRSDVTAAVNELVDAGLVKRSPDPRDRRRNLIQLTRPGAAHLRRMDRILADVQAKLLAALPDRDRHQLVRLLTRLLEVEGAGGGPAEPTP